MHSLVPEMRGRESCAVITTVTAVITIASMKIEPFPILPLQERNLKLSIVRYRLEYLYMLQGSAAAGLVLMLTFYILAA